MYVCICVYVYIYIYIYGRLFLLLFQIVTQHTFCRGCAPAYAPHIYIYIYAISRRGVRRHVRRIFSQLGLPIPGLPPFLIVLLKGSLKTICFRLFFYKTIREWSRSNFFYCFNEGRPQPYVLKGSSIKQCKSGPDPRRWGAPKCPGKHFRVCAGYAPSTFLEPIS